MRQSCKHLTVQRIVQRDKNIYFREIKTPLI